ncbi:DUF262 domain-containing protein [Crocosphaera sp.]|uniref:DUF262 domain-containing protein n=1 Tax=Crocosphaera sp. TaxID=2729996 RepID=UPI00262C0D17|nr:DUF262 domain-containing protein [Crocosphaera sp.]MDJ0581679.1 DUF262 domain-containing protein [Crocosphaera sp.]
MSEVIETNLQNQSSVWDDDHFIYEPEDINITTRKIEIDKLLSRIDNQSLNSAPDFLYRYHYWNNEVKSRLIESIIIRLPIGHFYLDRTGYDKWLIMDGIQRLYALKQFLSDKTLKLSGLEYLHDLEGKTYNEIERRYQRRIEETQVTVYLIEKGTPPDIKYNIGKRNSTGFPKSYQELRQALNPGKGNKLLAQLAATEEFKQLIPLDYEQRKQMDDRELILVFISFLLSDSFDDFPTVNLWLSRTLIKVNYLSDTELNELKDSCQTTFRQYLDRPQVYQLFSELSVNSTQLSKIKKLNKILSTQH